MHFRISYSFLCLAILAHSLDAAFLTEEFPITHPLDPISLDIPTVDITPLHQLQQTPLTLLPHASKVTDGGQTPFQRMFTAYQNADIAILNIDHGGVLISHTKDQGEILEEVSVAFKTIAALNANPKIDFVINTARNPYGVLKYYNTRAVGSMGTLYAKRFGGKWPDDVTVLEKKLRIPHAIEDTVRAWQINNGWISDVVFHPSSIIIHQDKDTTHSADKEQALRELLTLINTGGVYNYKDLPEEVKSRPRDSFTELPRSQFIVRRSPYSAKTFYTISHQHASKGYFLKSQLEKVAQDNPNKSLFVLCMGDDSVDEEMFKIARQHPGGYAVRVATQEQLDKTGQHLSHAQMTLKDHVEANELLRQFGQPQHASSSTT